MPTIIMLNEQAMKDVFLNFYLLEVGASIDDLVHKVLSGENIVLAEGGLNDGVVCEGNALLVDLAVSSLVYELTN
jgi:hypothetical protein